MGFATIFATLAFAFIFAAMIIFAATVQHNLAKQAAIEHDRDELAAKNSASQISIVASAYSTNSSAKWTDDLYSDFTGTTANTQVIGAGSVTLTGAQNGTYTSQPIDTGVVSPFYGTIAWTSVLPASTSIAFQVRSGATVPALTSATFTGPDGTAGTYYTSGAAINASNEFIQYQAYLNTSNPAATPELQSVTLGIARGVGVIYLNVTNTGTQKLTLDATDVYVNGQRVLRNDTKRTLTLVDIAGQALWDPSETAQIAVFKTTSGPAQVTVANGAATASTVVS